MRRPTLVLPLALALLAARYGAKDVVLIEVRDTTYDPSPGNNGGIERLSELLRKP